mmetsp:Transcript_83238/g.234816  ORF Transcript_83238/g.234816 Transcript_83238/m.234816 type:complete len:96 (-) Transcript_83238:800-1087(-)
MSQKLSLSGRARINVTEEGGEGGEESGTSTGGRAVENEEGEFDDTELRYEFCARVLITTQLAEAVSIFAATALVLALPPISFGPVGTPPISGGVL